MSRSEAGAESRRAGIRSASHATADPAPIFAALGDATRLRLVARLSDGQARSITQLTDGLGLTRQGVTKHLRVLQEAGLVSSIRVGRESQFAFAPEPVAQARSYLDAVSLQWDEALARLKYFVEGRASGRSRR
jgi:DNA-binding transcriptional ArsR family regulator